MPADDTVAAVLDSTGPLAKQHVDGATLEALHCRGINWFVVLRHWTECVRREWAELKRLQTRIGEASGEQRERLEADRKKIADHLRLHTLPLAQGRVFGAQTEKYIGESNRHLWQRVIKIIGDPALAADFQPLRIAISVASYRLMEWLGYVRAGRAFAAEHGLAVPHREIERHAAPDAAVLANKQAMLERAARIEASQPGASAVVWDLANRAAGILALRTRHHLVQFRMAGTDRLTGTTWFQMKTMGPTWPNPGFINHFSKGKIRMLLNDEMRHDAPYQAHDVVLEQLLSCPGIDPKEISLIELSDVDQSLSDRFGLPNTAKASGIQAVISADIFSGDARFHSFRADTPEGRLVNSVALALCKQMKQLCCFRYRAPVAPGDEQPDPSSPAAWRTDILIYIAPVRSIQRGRKRALRPKVA
ncbi:hypothetical protein ASB57_05790 [Bordetella sp. N]|nr:hypothetical protein ASB57_05790 [Bordetella sp. N]